MNKDYKEREYRTLLFRFLHPELFYVKNLADAVRAARENASMSQKKLAELAECDDRTILNIKNGRGNPQFHTLCTIMECLDIPYEQIFDKHSKSASFEKDRLTQMIHNCTDKEARELLPVVEPLISLVKKRNSDRKNSTAKN